MAELGNRGGASPDDNLVSLFRPGFKKKETAPLPIRRTRSRLVGALLGLGMGLIYGVISESINSVWMPGIPLAHHPFGLIGNCLATTLVGGIIGLACAWPRSAINGLLLSSLLTMPLLEVRTWLVNAVPASTLIRTLIGAPLVLLAASVLFLLAVPLMAVLRWAFDSQSQVSESLWSRKRLVPIMIVVALAGIGGALSLHPTITRQAIIQMNSLIRIGLAASGPDKLPIALSEQNNVKGFLVYANQDYTLEPNTYTNVTVETLTLSASESVVVIARFRGGWVLACLFNESRSFPICKSVLPDAVPQLYIVRGIESDDLLADRNSVLFFLLSNASFRLSPSKRFKNS